MLNERYGRTRCDEILHDLADNLSVQIPGLKAGGRIDGDVFAFLVDHSEDDLTERFGKAVADIGIAHLFVRFGIVDDVDHSLTATQLCDRAALAIEQLRDSVGVGVAHSDDALRQQREMEHLILEGAEAAFEESQFVVYYQPKHDVHTGRVAGAEALVRWIHPEIGFVQPGIFISIFEKNGMIARLDRYVREETCAELARLQQNGFPIVPISVNMSPLDFDDPTLAQDILEMADRYGIDHSWLHLELTETAYSEDPGDVVRTLTELRSHGFKIELDDFGSGYSSLALLNILPLDILKIDGLMVRHATRLDDFRIIQAAIQIAQLLGLETVIEGVETVETLGHLRFPDRDLIQGFFYSWPLRQKEFEEYLLSH